jgi:hypothetical protein
MLRSNVSLLLLTLCFISCGGDPATAPDAVPTPTPVPIPVPTATPSPSGPNLQEDTYCVPAPPPLADLRIKVHQDFGFKKVLDARALVGPDAAHCASINMSGTVCVVRREDDPQAATCNNLVVGKADSGLYGPNWFYNDDTFCRSSGEGGNEAGCRQHETNQYLVYAFGPGRYTACSAGADPVCATIEIP